MYCESCGNLVPDGQAFCSNCGAAVAQAAPAAQPAPAPMAAAPVAAPAPAPAPAPQPMVQPQPAQPAYQQLSTNSLSISNLNTSSPCIRLRLINSL